MVDILFVVLWVGMTGMIVLGTAPFVWRRIASRERRRRRTS
jgi:hypothetical protein